MDKTKVTPRHQKFINAIADSHIHIIATMRGKDQYEMEKDERGKTSVKKLGVGAKQRDGFEYEFTCTFLLDQKTNTAEVQKDNSHIFEGESSILLTEDHGRKLIKWANEGEGYTPSSRTVAEREQTETTQATNDEFTELQNKVIALCKAKGGSENTELMDILKQFNKNGNPKGIKSLDKLQECFKAIDAYEYNA